MSACLQWSRAVFQPATRSEVRLHSAPAVFWSQRRQLQTAAVCHGGKRRERYGQTDINTCIQHKQNNTVISGQHKAFLSKRTNTKQCCKKTERVAVTYMCAFIVFGSQYKLRHCDDTRHAPAPQRGRLATPPTSDAGRHSLRPPPRPSVVGS